MPGNENNVTPTSYTSVSENGATTLPIPTPRTSTPKQNGKKINPPSFEEAEKAISNVLSPILPTMRNQNPALLIFNFNQTIVDNTMWSPFAHKNYNDYDSGKENAVTKEKIEEFLQNSGIKNKEKLRSVLQSALSSEVGVAIVSSTHPKTVEYIVKNHLDLTEEKAQNIKVFEGITKRQTPRTEDPAKIAEKMTKPQDPQIGKHLCVLYLLKAYKKDKYMLPQKVMLVDGNMQNTNPANNFRRNIKELLEKDMKSFLENIDQEIEKVDISEGELEKITFKRINVSGKTNDDYLNEAEKWIESNKIHYSALDSPTPNGSVHDESESATHASMEDSLDNNFDISNLNKPSSQLNRKSSNSTCSTPPPSYKTNGSENSFILDSKSDTDNKFKLQRKRVLPKMQYTMQQKGVAIFGATAIVLGTSLALAYLQDKAKFIAFFTNSPLYIIVPIITVASLLAISPIFLGIKQFINTKEYKTQEKNADEVLDNVLKHQPEGKAIKYVRLEYSNGTHSNFVLNAWESKDDFINIDEKVISKTNKIESIINNRPIFTALLTCIVVANLALPSLLYAEGGVNNIQKFYQNPLINNIGLSLLIGSGVLALLAVYFGIHYYRKTNCTNLIYSEEKIDPKNVNEKFIEEIKRERTNVLGENHSKDAKRSSLTLDQVVVQSHNYKDVIYSVDR